MACCAVDMNAPRTVKALQGLGFTEKTKKVSAQSKQGNPYKDRTISLDDFNCCIIYAVQNKKKAAIALNRAFAKLALIDFFRDAFGEQPLQQGYFCAFLEMMKFFQELEVHAQYIVPDINPETDKYIVPDISIGQRFNRWLRSEDDGPKQARLEILGSDEPIDFRPQRLNRDRKTHQEIRIPAGNHNREIVRYNHVYPEVSHGSNNVQLVNSYPDKYLPIFKYYLSKIWIPECCHGYISQRDPDGWAFAVNNLLQMPSTARIGLSKTLVGALIPSLPEAS